jgi:hypothetical protein
MAVFTGEWFSVVSNCQVVTFRLSEIVAIERPNWPSKPAGWPDYTAANVFLRNRTDCIGLNREQWEQLQGMLVV